MACLAEATATGTTTDAERHPRPRAKGPVGTEVGAIEVGTIDAAAMAADLQVDNDQAVRAQHGVVVHDGAHESSHATAAAAATCGTPEPHGGRWRCARTRVLTGAAADASSNEQWSPWASP